MRLRPAITSLFAVLSIVTLQLGAMSVVYAEEFDPVKNVCNKINGQSEFCSSQPTKDPISGTDGIILGAARITALVAGISAIIIIIIAGARMITSSGDANSVSKARSTVVYAAVGLVIAAIAPSIVSYVLKNVIK